MAIIDLNYPEAIALLRGVAEPYTMRASLIEQMRIKFIDAVLQLEDGVPCPFAVDLAEEECWIIDQLLQEDTKDLSGVSLRPLRRKVWRALRDFHEEELMIPPQVPVTEEGNQTYKEAQDANRDPNPCKRPDEDSTL